MADGAVTREAVKLARSLCGSDVGESSWRVEVLEGAIADAEARGRAESSAEVARLRERLNQHEGRYDTGGLLRDAPTPASAELAADVATVRKSIGERLEVSQHGLAHDCLSRIAAALGLGGGR